VEFPEVLIDDAMEIPVKLPADPKVEGIKRKHPGRIRV
jgi:hypothetical protein